MREKILLGITIFGMILIFALTMNAKVDTNVKYELSSSSNMEVELIPFDDGYPGDIML